MPRKLMSSGQSCVLIRYFRKHNGCNCNYAAFGKVNAAAPTAGGKSFKSCVKAWPPGHASLATCAGRLLNQSKVVPSPEQLLRHHLPSCFGADAVFITNCKIGELCSTASQSGKKDADRNTVVVQPLADHSPDGVRLFLEWGARPVIVAPSTLNWDPYPCKRDFLTACKVQCVI